MNNGLKKHESYYKNFILERFLAVVSFVAMLTLFACALKIKNLDYLNIVLWLSNPLNMFVLVVAVGFAIFYALEGLKVILTDYVPNNLIRVLTIYFLNSLAFAMFTMFVISVLFLGV